MIDKIKKICWILGVDNISLEQMARLEGLLIDVSNKDYIDRLEAEFTKTRNYAIEYADILNKLGELHGIR